MTPREIIFAAMVAQEREQRRKSDALILGAIAAHDPKQAVKLSEELIR